MQISSLWQALLRRIRRESLPYNLHATVQVACQDSQLARVERIARKAIRRTVRRMTRDGILEEGGLAALNTELQSKLGPSTTTAGGSFKLTEMKIISVSIQD